MNTLAAIVIGGSGLISILLNFLILMLVLGLVYYILTLLPLPQIFLTIAQIVFAIIAIIWLCSLFTGCSTPPTAEQAQAYANAAHTLVHGALIDAKDASDVYNNIKQ